MQVVEDNGACGIGIQDELTVGACAAKPTDKGLLSAGIHHNPRTICRYAVVSDIGIANAHHFFAEINGKRIRKRTIEVYGISQQYCVSKINLKSARRMTRNAVYPGNGYALQHTPLQRHYIVLC